MKGNEKTRSFCKLLLVSDWPQQALWPRNHCRWSIDKCGRHIDRIGLPASFSFALSSSPRSLLVLLTTHTINRCTHYRKSPSFLSPPTHSYIYINVYYRAIIIPNYISSVAPIACQKREICNHQNIIFQWLITFVMVDLIIGSYSGHSCLT